MSAQHLRRRARVTQWTFGAIVAFLIAQVAWWLWFQADYIGGVTASTKAAWHDDADLANRIAAIEPTAVDELMGAHPHLRLEAGRFVVDEERLSEFVADQRSALRMFMFEGVFFVLVTLSGLLVLARSVAAARELEMRQHNFLLAVTHEFRTPISAMRLLIETLLYRDPPRERLEEYLRRMERELTRLQRSSDQVLASARLEQLAQLDEATREDLDQLVPALVNKVRGSYEARGARLTVVPAGEPLPVRLPPEAFELVLTNLLDNAVKYSPGPEKPVLVELARRGDIAALAVEDEGVGVPPKEAEKVFERFYRPGSEMTRRSQGVGLGLYLVRSIVELMGGRVACEPRQDGRRGTRFTVTLPLAPAAEAAGRRGTPVRGAAGRPA